MGIKCIPRARYRPEFFGQESDVHYSFPMLVRQECKGACASVVTRDALFGPQPHVGILFCATSNQDKLTMRTQLQGQIWTEI